MTVVLYPGSFDPIHNGHVEIVETEQRTRAAVALCVDTSWSMVQDGRWVPMKRTALALHQLVTTRFRGDELMLITFGRHARRVELGELVGLDGAWEQGTNLHHALLLAGQHLPDRGQRVDRVIRVQHQADGQKQRKLREDDEAADDQRELALPLIAAGEKPLHEELIGAM